jgi:hypothetical protein
MTRADVIASAQNAKLDLAPDTTGEDGFGVWLRLYPVGRAICSVTLDDDVVVSTRYETS